MSEVFSLDPHALEQFLERRRASLPNFEPEMSLADNLVEVLRKADEFVHFVPKVTSPRGGHFVGDTLYLIHPPFLSSYRGTNGDGVADQF